MIARPCRRPVLVSGFPGLTIPAEPKAIVYREQVDLIVLHSRREVREFHANAERLRVPVELGLATLPFLRTAALQHAGAATVAASDSLALDLDRTDLVFAAQAKVPSLRDDRVRLLGWLADAARRRPQRRVVVKVRAARARRRPTPSRTTSPSCSPTPRARGARRHPAAEPRRVEDGPMSDHLARASALVTVSSTAVLEAIAVGVPALVIDAFGVEPKLINTVFVGSGLLGGADALVAGGARHPEPAWLEDNYFHGADADDWLQRLDGLVARRGARRAGAASRRSIGAAEPCATRGSASGPSVGTTAARSASSRW